METAWYELLAPDWPQLRAICERDVVHRAGLLSRSGWVAALDGLHPRVRWRGEAIEMLRSAENRTVPLGGQGLLLVPSVFLWPEVAAHAEQRWPATLIYPARGIAALWESPPSAIHGALGDLAGRTRAGLLAALDRRPAPPSWPAASGSPPARSATTSRCCTMPGCSPKPCPGALSCTGAPRSGTPSLPQARARQARQAGERQAASWNTRPRVWRRPDLMTDTPCRTGAADQPCAERTGRSRVVNTSPRPRGISVAVPRDSRSR
jgi:hypothetical protein